MFARHSARYLVSTFGLFILFLALWLLLRGYWYLPVVAYTPVMLFILWFFRDPERTIGTGVVSPADGKVLFATEDKDASRLVIFMPPTGVHVNRAPVAGEVVRTTYRQGSHIPAFRKESERNERFDVQFRTADGDVHIGLIAGTVARRIHPYIGPGNALKKGDRIGLIAFGSRCDLALPPGRFRWKVKPGDWVKAGETTVAEMG
ncbi:MAG TPA: phosphatidylserine decarboxylase [Candidatus Thermoplasmatota archaeon]